MSIQHCYTTDGAAPRASSLPAELGGEFSARLLSSAEEMSEVRGLWDELSWNPNAQADFFELINQTRPEVLRPCVILLEHKGRPSGVLVGRVVNQVFRIKVGYKHVGIGRVRELSIIYGGVLGCDDESCAEVAMALLRRLLKGGEIDLVLLSHVDVASPLFRVAMKRAGILFRDHFIPPQPHWRTTLPKNGDEFLKRLNKKHRYWVRRLERLLEQDFPEQVSFRCFSNTSHLGELMEHMECVAKKTYQRQLGAGFINDPEHAQRFALEARKGWLRAYVLYVKGQPCAFWSGTLYKGVYHSCFTGYDPDFRDYEPGTITFMRMVQSLCEENAVAIDYGQGDALYKQRFGDSSWCEANLRLFAPSIRGLGLSLAQTIIEAPVSLAKSLLERAKLQQRLKSFWRRRLTSGSGT